MIVPPEAPENPRGLGKYRFKRGTKLADMPPVPPQALVPPLAWLDGPFQLAEYLALKVRADPHNVQALVDAPSDITKASERHVWVYEHLRRIPTDVTPLITQLLQLCDRETCPEMKADEWQYLCVAHGGEGTDRCCAIDYILHTLDSTSSLLNSSKYFPSRLQIPDSSLSHFPSLFRRLSRIFSHAYYHHREAFATSEAETSLYRRFVALCHKYELVGPSLLIIPHEGYEGIVMADEDDDMDNDPRDDAGDIDWDDDHDHEEDEEDGDSGLDNKDEESRGRDQDDSGSSGRSQSLGRHSSVSPNKWTASPMQPATKSKPAPAKESATQSPPSIRSQLDVEPVIPTTVQGRGTLSRGKGSRGSTTNMWAQAAASAADTPATVPEDVPSSVIGMARKESVDSVVHMPLTDGEDLSPPKPSVSPRRTPSPIKSPLKVETTSLPERDEKDTPTPDDSSSLPTPIPTHSPALPIIAKDDTTSLESLGSDAGTDIPVLFDNNKASSPSKSPVKISVSPKSQLTASRPEVLDSPKSELLPSSSPKSELLSVSPKQSPSGNRGGRGGGGGNGGGGGGKKPKTPTKSKPKSSSPKIE